jgi:uncharacterized protein YabE (DUF348 family)
MKKHHHFERRNTKAILISALAAATVVGFTGCADEGEMPSMPITTLESTYFTEAPKSEAVFPEQTTQADTTPLETTAQTVVSTEQTTLEITAQATTEAVKTEPVVHTERTEEYADISYDTRYEYSDRYYKGTLQTKQAGKKGTLLRVTVTTYEDGVALDASVTETVIHEPVEKVIIVGTKETITQTRLTVTENVIPYRTETRKDASRYDDERSVLQEGKDGYTEAVYLITYEKGVEISRERISEKVFDVQNEIVSVGAKPAWKETSETERTNTVPYKTEYIYDNTVMDGKRIVKTAGKDGYTENLYAVKYYRGKLSSKELVKSTVYEPTTEVIIIGTKKEESFGLPFLANKGYALTQDFGGSHYAMDFGVWYGDPILAVKSGTVIYAYDEGDFPKSDANWTYGTFVVIEHENGVRSLYAHLKSRTVKAGQKVSGGQVIGYSGNTGRVNPAPTASNPLAGTHLHFEIRVKKNGSYVKVDPKHYIPYK